MAGDAVGIYGKGESDPQVWVFLLKSGDGGVPAGIHVIVVQSFAFDIEIEPGEVVAIDRGLIFGFELLGIVVGDGEFGTGCAAEGDDDVAAVFADGFDLVSVEIFLHGDAAEPGGFAFLVGDDEGEGVMLLGGGFFALGELEAVVGAEPNVGGEEALWPIGI